MARNGLSVALTILVAVAAPLAAGAASVSEAREIALDHLRSTATEHGLAAGDVAGVAVTDVVPTRHNGVTHVYLRQTVNDLEIDGTEVGLHVDRNGRVFHRTGTFVPGVSGRAAAAPTFPAVSQEAAIRSAARQLGVRQVDADLALEESSLGADRKQVYSSPELSEDPIPVRLRYLRGSDSDRLTLAWNLVLKMTGGDADWWDVWVDATTGEIVRRVNWTSHATYRVYASPQESPDDGDRTDEVDPHVAGGTSPTTGASPFGWHDLNGAVGAETTLTSGNNVNACVDAVAPANACDPGSQPDGGGTLVFQPAIDLSTQQPADYMDAAVVNLYYWNNLMHDVTYQYGFDEAAGNFQENNYGRGGAGSDSVNADAQDLSGLNNANFGTGPDGQNPRMQMFVWTNPFAQQVTINSPGPIAGTYVANPSNNGGTANGLTADLAIVVDGTPPTTDACQAVTNDLTGKIALILWSEGVCNSSVFVLNAANAGAVAAIIIDSTDVPLTNFGGNAAIPSVAVGNADGLLFMDTITGGATVNGTIDDNPAGQINRDSDLDAGVIAHEYGHGISNRLTGGPGTASCLGNQEQMGEGWSDWQTLFLHAKPADTATTPRPIGTYLTFEDPDAGFGIRAFPYNTDNTANPLTYSDIPTQSVPHGVGAVWANTLWEVYWLLIDEFGYDPDIYHGTGGNNIAHQLVIDGMKLQPCQPGFVTGRDGILAADQANYDGDLACHIWTGFADRGVGFGASQGSSNVIGDETESFALPPQCIDLIFADSFGFGTDRWSAVSP
ncbi:MAG: peptidase M36 [Acidobacteriota bacterium]